MVEVSLQQGLIDAGNHFAEGHHEKALEIWRNLKIAFPNSPRPILDAARALVRTSDFAACDALLSAEVERPEVRRDLLADWVDVATRREDWPEVIRRARILQNENPDDITGFLADGRALFQIGKKIDADNIFSELTIKFPNDERSWSLWADCALWCADWSAALVRSKFVKEMSPDKPFGYIVAGRALRELGRLDDAEEAFKEATTRYPDDRSALAEWANFALWRRNWTDAASRAELLSARYPDWALGYVNNAKSLRHLGKNIEAESILSQANKKFPNDLFVLIESVENLFILEKWSAAVEKIQFVLSKINSNKKEFIISKFYLAKSYYELKKYENSQRELLDLISNSYYDFRVLEIASDISLHIQNCEWFSEGWQKFFSDPNVDRRRLAEIARKLYGRFDSWPNANVFVEWILFSDYQDYWIAQGLKSINDLVMRATSFPTAAKNLSILYNSIDSNKISPFIRCAVGPYFGYVPSHEELTDLLCNCIPEMYNKNWHLNPIFNIFYFSQGRSPNFLEERREVIVSSFKSALEIILSKSHDETQDAAYNLFFLIIADVISPDLTDWLVNRARERKISGMSLSTPQGVIEKISQAALTYPNVIMSDRHPRVCLEISGQLRGFRQAFESWNLLSLPSDHVVSVVHTWSKIGTKLPIDPLAASRTFSGNFQAEYIKVLAEYGWDVIKVRYPKLMRYLANSGEVSENDLKSFYKTEHAIVENDEFEDFRNKPNMWKMYYKIYAAHQLAIDVSGDCDLYVRIRPDFVFRTELNLDWREIWATSRSRKVIYTYPKRYIDTAYCTIWMGDQIAFGNLESMSAYAEAFLDTKAAQQGGVYNYPVDFYPHENIAYSTMYRGVSVNPLNGLGGNPLLNPPAIDVLSLEKALYLDISNGPRDFLDERLLEALKIDLNY